MTFKQKIEIVAGAAETSVKVVAKRSRLAILVESEGSDKYKVAFLRPSQARKLAKVLHDAADYVRPSKKEWRSEAVAYVLRVATGDNDGLYISEAVVNGDLTSRRFLLTESPLEASRWRDVKEAEEARVRATETYRPLVVVAFEFERTMRER